MRMVNPHTPVILSITPVSSTQTAETRADGGSAEIASAGLGIAYAPHFAVCDGLKSGTLVELLEGYTQDTISVNAVYLEGRILPRKIRALIDFSAKDIRSSGVI